MIRALSVNIKVFITVIVLSITLVLTISGCGSTKSEGIIDILKKVPKDWSFEYVNLDAFRNDSDLKEYTPLGEEDLFLNLDFVGGLREIDNIIIAEGEGSSMEWNVLLGGNFNLDKVRKNLEDLGLHKGEYRGIEVWEESAALVSNELIILGYIDSCITAILDSNTSLYSDKNYRDIAERLPDGIAFAFQDDALNIYGFYESYNGLVSSGLSMLKKDKHSMTITYICKFEDLDSANQALDSIKQYIENDTNEEFRDASVKQNDEFIEVVIDMYIRDCFSDANQEDEYNLQAANSEVAAVKTAAAAEYAHTGSWPNNSADFYSNGWLDREPHALYHFGDKLHIDSVSNQTGFTAGLLWDVDNQRWYR